MLDRVLFTQLVDTICFFFTTCVFCLMFLQGGNTPEQNETFSQNNGWSKLNNSFLWIILFENFVDNNLTLSLVFLPLVSYI